MVDERTKTSNKKKTRRSHEPPTLSNWVAPKTITVTSSQAGGTMQKKMKDEKRKEGKVTAPASSIEDGSTGKGK